MSAGEIASAMALLDQGESYRKVAGQFNVAIGTIQFHRKHRTCPAPSTPTPARKPPTHRRKPVVPAPQDTYEEFQAKVRASKAEYLEEQEKDAPVDYTKIYGT